MSATQVFTPRTYEMQLVGDIWIEEGEAAELGFSGPKPETAGFRDRRDEFTKEWHEHYKVYARWGKSPIASILGTYNAKRREFRP